MVPGRDRPRMGRGGVTTTCAALAVACAMAACGDGPTESDGTRVCEVPIRLISPVGTGTDAPALPVPVSPVSDANCLPDPPVIRLPVRDSTTIDIPVPRPPIPMPVPGGD